MPLVSRSAGSLRRARLHNGLTQAQIAEKIGVSQAMISNWESGRAKITGEWFAEIERVLGELDGKNLNDEDTAVAESAEGIFGQWLRRTRERKGLTAAELSHSSGVSMVQIYNIEAGRSLNPRTGTREKLASALKEEVPAEIESEVAEEQNIVGLGSLADFDPHDPSDSPAEPGVYVFYDVSDRPIYVGKSSNIQARVHKHKEDKWWFRAPIVSRASYIKVADGNLRHQLEQVLIKFMKSNAVINRQSVERD